MAIKSRLLSKLKFTYMTTTMAATAHPQKLRPVLHNLEEARKLCQQGLTESNYAKYGEVYDGLIMAIKQILSGEAGKDAGEIVGLCKELLEHIMAETSKEEHFKKEIVFLPYKASMWDSLESVWRAAYEDKDNCLAYVVPIPYCDRNPDGTAKEWHCERDLFPQDVPTLDWQEVDLKAMHPDVIFFHYPYDDCNRVTSPSQEYYSRNLKKYADKLVYIPYFVTGKGVKPNFIQEPGVNNADYVIVENEKIKAIYEEYYSGGKLPEGKILALGSPKYDKVIASRKEDYPLPEAWERLIAGRKIILYNTSLQAHLAHSDKILEKLYSVLLYFKERKDLAFWWRPHPLLEATLDSMLPHVASVYCEIRDAYLQEGWGIYDDTPELERAIVWSDAYYGDTSSVVELYSKTGKPIMIQDMEVSNIT
ncbi:CDP-glycerol glycerophosphotransferase family protein [Selenomonas ruminantium]|uniref:CDP-Glycerol:Poly(Glycerophosphate) glycerophosphotransferase n=1 Tax=Selenomonas ruminantium TaxID=971 RepID=A0A1K1N9L0_SELRU|nr:CDP-glycerol glycerophosphotransferase family protein [Selenomonas ruminantium]SFW31941.1 CDP-Glycerol:Poly(glycerophosphate) glycerophosphotransferase [Selenomonas ruminantium]